ncbi:MAG: LTA synthase family protein [Proteobacteria bacterium]|nr:LTA synthase family protein [Pseudomonadota bacterium]
MTVSKNHRWLKLPCMTVVLLFILGSVWGCKIGPDEPSSMVAEFEKLDGNVVLLFMDGVRWQDFKGAADPSIPRHPDYDSLDEFDEAEFDEKILASFWEKHAKKGLAFGLDPKGNALMEVLNYSKASFASFSSIFSGKPVGCTTNDCPRVSGETFLERIKRKRGYEKEQIAAFYYEIEQNFPKSLESEKGTIHLVESNNLSKNYDRMTFQMALDYLDNRPRISVIYLAMTDWCGHIKNYRCYVDRLKEYDGYIDRLFEKLETMEGYGEKTAVLILTDHGRGAAPHTFNGHGILEAKNVWMFIAGPYIRTSIETNGIVTSDHGIDQGIIRPLVETIMGLYPIYPGARYTEFMDESIFSVFP